MKGVRYKMSVLTDFVKHKRYIKNGEGNYAPLSEWTSTDTTELSNGVTNSEVKLKDAKNWLTTYDNTNSQPTTLTELVSKITTYFTNTKYLKNRTDELLDLIHPVGSVYWSRSSKDPSTIFGGTWVQIKDKFILAAGNNYSVGNVGGSASLDYTPAGTISNKALTVEQMPAHAHTLLDATGVAAADGSAHTHTYAYPVFMETDILEGENGFFANDRKGDERWVWVQTGEGYDVGNARPAAEGAPEGAHTHNVTLNDGETNIVGESRPHNHDFTGTQATLDKMPPYAVYYCWERTA